MQNTAQKALTFALAGFTLLSIGDVVIKSMAGMWPGPAVAALRYFFGTCILAGLLFWREGRAGFVVPSPWLQLARGASIAMGSALFFLSIFAMPLTEATVIQFMNPMLVALLSGVILSERVPRAAITAIAIAFAGVLIVLRPEVTRIGWAGALPLAAALFLALTLLFNRKAAGLGSALQMQFLISVFATPVLILTTLIGHFSGVAALHLGLPAPAVVARCALVGVTASFAHGLMFMATERAPAAAVAPAVYVQLLIAMGFGWAVYGDRPDLAALAGAALIVGAGLYLWRNGR